MAVYLEAANLVGTGKPPSQWYKFTAWVHADTEEEMRQVGSLLVAAPDLLAALQTALPDLQEQVEAIAPVGCDHAVNICVCGYRRTIEQVEAAIAKATGKEA